jgi:hypothetical protein
MIIIQSFYYAVEASRHLEIITTLKLNLLNEKISEIHLFITNEDYIKLNSDLILRLNLQNIGKIKLIISDKQPTYFDLFNYSISIENKYVCICNSDIEVQISNDNYYLLPKYLLNTNCIFFITRNEVDGTRGLIDGFCGSHDAFIFHSNMLKIKIDLLSELNYIQNTQGVEAILTIIFIEKLRYFIYNPCYQIPIIHHHSSNLRPWKVSADCVGYTSKNKLNLNGVHNSYMIYPVILQ